MEEQYGFITQSSLYCKKDNNVTSRFKHTETVGRYAVHYVQSKRSIGTNSKQLHENINSLKGTFVVYGNKSFMGE